VGVGVKGEVFEMEGEGDTEVDFMAESVGRLEGEELEEGVSVACPVMVFEKVADRVGAWEKEEEVQLVKLGGALVGETRALGDTKPDSVLMGVEEKEKQAVTVTEWEEEADMDPETVVTTVAVKLEDTVDLGEVVKSPVGEGEGVFTEVLVCTGVAVDTGDTVVEGVSLLMPLMDAVTEGETRDVLEIQLVGEEELVAGSLREMDGEGE